MLTDTGPLVAIIDKREPDHKRCVDILKVLKDPMVTTWPVLVETMYLLGSAYGWHVQKALWRMILSGDLQIEQMNNGQFKRMYKLMDKYHDVPMDLADASLVTVAELHNINQIFTLDSDFHIYRLSGNRTFVTVPE